MPGYTYTSFKAALVAEINQSASSINLMTVLPTIIDQAEGMIYREPNLAFLSSIVTDTTGSATTNNREFTLPRHFSVLKTVQRVVGNDRITLDPVSRDVLEFLHPSVISATVNDMPTVWAPLTDQKILLGPCPGFAVGLVCTGEVQPAPLSESNPTTWLSQYLPDVFFAAAMVFASAAQRNFGAQADDPKMAMSWTEVYKDLMAGVNAQELRRKFGGA